jgi:hypothetical protein
MRKPIIGGIKECKLLKELVADLLILHRSGAAILISLKTLKTSFSKKTQNAKNRENAKKKQNAINSG